MLPILILVHVVLSRNQTSDCILFRLMSITPWMFTVDRVNYAQWLPVNVHNTEIFCSPSATRAVETITCHPTCVEKSSRE